MRGSAIACLLGLALVAAPAVAEFDTVWIATANHHTIDRYDDLANSHVYVRDPGCEPSDPFDVRCANSTDSTAVSVLEDAFIGGDFVVLDGSLAGIRGDVGGSLVAHALSRVSTHRTAIWEASVGAVEAHEASNVSIRGHVVGDVDLFDVATGELWATVGGSVRLHDASLASTVTGVIDGGLEASGQAHAIVYGGAITQTLRFSEQATGQLSGGVLLGGLQVADLAQVEVIGGDFVLDGIPVAAGEVIGQSGVLEASFSDFHHGALGGILARDPGARLTLVDKVALIANGAAPPNAENVIDAADFYFDAFVRNVGCGAADPFAACEAPGPPTRAVLRDGANVRNGVRVDDGSVLRVEGGSAPACSAAGSSLLEIDGDALIEGAGAADGATLRVRSGTVQGITGWNSASVNIDGGDIEFLEGRIESHLTLRGGTIGFLSVGDSATARLVARDVAVDGVPVTPVIWLGGDGAVFAQTGTLTGTWASGAPFSIDFHQTSGAQITVPEPAASLAGFSALLGLAVLRARRGP